MNEVYFSELLFRSNLALLLTVKQILFSENLKVMC